MTYPGHTPYAPWLLEQGLPHNAWDLVVVREPVGRLAEQWARLEEEWAKHGDASAAWPSEGVFAVKWLVEGDQAGRSEGRLVHVGERELNQLREDLVRLDVDDLYRLREFLERWGLLGIGVVPVLNPSLADAVHFYGLSEYSWQGADDVAATRACLRELQRLAHGTDPDALPRLWEELEGATLCNVSVTVSRTGLEPRRTAWGLLGVIMLALPLWAKTQARRCGNERCSNLVIIPKKKFCSWECYNRFHVALSKKKARALRRLSQGESVSAVAKQHGLTPALVRQWQREKRQKKDPKPRRPKR